jgi:hypothetical protein
MSMALFYWSVRNQNTILGADMRTLAASIVIAISLVSTALAQQETPTTASLEGVWKVTKVVQAGIVNTNPQPGLLIFTRGYYSATRVTASEARKQSPAPKDPAHLTDAEKIAFYNEWAGYVASAGTYEVKGNTIINHNILAKMVGGMTLTEEAIILNFDGNSFVATPKAGNPNSDRQTTYTRVR